MLLTEMCLVSVVSFVKSAEQSCNPSPFNRKVAFGVNSGGRIMGGILLLISDIK